MNGPGSVGLPSEVGGELLRAARKSKNPRRIINKGPGVDPEGVKAPAAGEEGKREALILAAHEQELQHMGGDAECLHVL